jgi:hypothetical protein
MPSTRCPLARNRAQSSGSRRDIHHSNHETNISLVHIVLKALRQHGDLVSVLAFDESLHAIVLARCVDKVYRAATFLHALGQDRPFERTVRKCREAAIRASRADLCGVISSGDTDRAARIACRVALTARRRYRITAFCFGVTMRRDPVTEAQGLGTESRVEARSARRRGSDGDRAAGGSSGSGGCCGSST